MKFILQNYKGEEVNCPICGKLNKCCWACDDCFTSRLLCLDEKDILELTTKTSAKLITNERMAKLDAI
jgi:hypothetical protein